MKKPIEINGVELEKAEAIRQYNNRRTYRNLLRLLAVALLCCLWFPTVQIVGDWFYRTGSVIVTNRTFVFFLVNLLIVSILVLSRDDQSKESSDNTTEPDLYDRYTSSLTGFSGEEVEKAGDDLRKQIVPAFIPEVEKVVVVVEEEEEESRELVVTTTDTKREFRRTKSEKTKKGPVKEYRRTESTKMAIERMSSEEFRLKVESFIMEKKKSLVL